MSEPTTAGLTLLLGPANSGKMGQVFRWWQERAGAGGIVVAPTGPDARELTAEMVKRTGALLGQSPAVTFDGLVHLILRLTPRYASELESTLVLSQIVRETSLEALGHAVGMPGTVIALAALFRQLGESGKDGAEVESLLQRWATVEPEAGPLAGDIGRLGVAFARAMSHLHLSNRPAAVLEAVRALRSGDVPATAALWRRPVALYGFTSFTLGQRALVEELSRHTEVLLVFTHDASRSVSLVAPSEVSWWRARASQEVSTPAQALAYDSPAIGYLAQYFMGDEPPAMPPPPVFSDHAGVRFLIASGRRAEAELAAEHITELLKAGFRPGEIAVVVRQVSQWAALLGDVFRSCDIPVRVDDRRTLDQTGLGYAFLAALRGVSRDDAAGILAYLRSPYSGLSLDNVSDLELAYRRGTATGAAGLTRVAAAMGLGGLSALWEVAGPNLQVPAAEELARDMLVAGSRGATAGSEDLEDDARAYVALRQALTALGDLADGLAGGAASASSLETSTMLGVLAGLSVRGRPGLEEDAVQVLSVQRARARRFPVVVILGLVEGEFPARQQPPSLLSPAQRRRLDKLGGGLFAPEADQESALFVSAVSRASRLLLLSARDAEDDGGQASRSHFWEMSRRLLGVPEADQACRTLADQVFTPQTAPTHRHYLRACAARGVSSHPTVSTGGQRPGPAWERPRASLTAAPVLADLAATEHFSPSALESYLNCPFAWFVERVIGAEDIDYELDRRLVGQMLHSVLSTTYQQLDSSGLLPLRLEGLEHAQQIADAAVEQSVRSDEYPGSVAERRLAGCLLKRMARNLFEMEAEAASDVRLLHTEMWVGGQEGTDVGGLRVLGRIDRVDCTSEGRGLFVLDYKSGSIPGGADLGTETALQLPLYMLAVMNEYPQSAVLGGAYLSLADKKRTGFVMAGAECHLGGGTDGYRILGEEGAEELFDRTRTVARAAADGMRAGSIAPRPDRRCPPWCRLGPACRAQTQGYRP